MFRATRWRTTSANKVGESAEFINIESARQWVSSYQNWVIRYNGKVIEFNGVWH